MKRLRRITLIRHAEAEYPDTGNDFDRILTKRGLEESSLLGNVLSCLDEPDLVLSSAAPRALETAKRVLEAADFDDGVLEEDMRLYEWDAKKVMSEIIPNLEDESDRVWIVGHNPTLEQIAKSMVPEFEYHFSKAAAIQVEAEVESWADFSLHANFVFWKCLRKRFPDKELKEVLRLEWPIELDYDLDQFFKLRVPDTSPEKLSKLKSKIAKAFSKVAAKPAFYTVKSLPIGSPSFDT